MKKTTLNIIIMIALVICGASCTKDHWIKGEGSNVTNVRSLSGFTGISLSMNANVEIVQDSVFRIELNGQQNILNVVTTSVSGNTLDIDLKRHTAIRRHNTITIKIFMPVLASVDISGSGEVQVNNGFTCANLNANISGSGNISFLGNVSNSVTANVSGSGEININSNSNCFNAKYTISGSGDINAEWLKADYVDATISGSGDQKIYAVKQLDARISGSGDITYRGTPAVSVNISGSGKIRQIQ
jgi:hypothetical protein